MRIAAGVLLVIALLSLLPGSVGVQTIFKNPPDEIAEAQACGQSMPPGSDVLKVLVYCEQFAKGRVQGRWIAICMQIAIGLVGLGHTIALVTFFSKGNNIQLLNKIARIGCIPGLSPGVVLGIIPALFLFFTTRRELIASAPRS